MITCDEEMLKNIVKQMNLKIDDISTSINRINYNIEKLGNLWQGQDANKYIQVMKEKNIPELEKMCTILKKYSLYLQLAANSYDLLDDIYSSKNIGG